MPGIAGSFKVDTTAVNTSPLVAIRRKSGKGPRDGFVFAGNVAVRLGDFRALRLDVSCGPQPSLAPPLHTSSCRVRWSHWIAGNFSIDLLAEYLEIFKGVQDSIHGILYRPSSRRRRRSLLAISASVHSQTWGDLTGIFLHARAQGNGAIMSCSSGGQRRAVYGYGWIYLVTFVFPASASLYVRTQSQGAG